MRITRWDHATFVLEKEGKQLVVDPGNFTRPFEVDNVAAVVITHEHADHWDAPHLNALRKANPTVPIYGPEGVKTLASSFDITVVAPGDKLSTGPFELEFFGGIHAVIHSSIPVVQNVGVLVDGGVLYYPGDSFAVPEGVTVDVLATPASAPWLKIAEVMDFVLAVAPRRAFPTHDRLNSDLAQGMAEARIAWAAEQNGGALWPLHPGDGAEI